MAKATADVSVTIDRPVGEVFDFMSRYDHNVEWQEGVVSSAQITPGEPRVGVEVRYAREVLGRRIESTSTMVVHEPAQRLRMRSESALFTYEGGYDFDGDEASTRVHFRGEITTKALLGFVARGLAGRFQTQMESDLARLKRLLEGRA
ncbi:MAG: SRPBCC family protein [Alphaproteobacteria bacterium]|nr:SRPBCC family protein [Alphaproteobacteria bacterium]